MLRFIAGVMKETLLMTNYYCHNMSPLGVMTIQCNDEGLSGIWFEQHTTLPDELGIENAAHPLLQRAKIELKEYFAGQRQTFHLPLSVQGTAFQQDVWQALKSIPYGQTTNYQAIAEQIGRPKAVRAVGAANGKNPLSIVIPCHRVIGKSGKLVGYAGGESRKEALLKLENSHLG